MTTTIESQPEKFPVLIFDFGNVLAFFDLEKATAKLGEKLGLSGRELFDQLGPLNFRDHLQRYESGQTSATEFSALISTMIRLEISHEDFAAAWVEIFTANESIIPLVASLKRQGYRLLLGSNTNDMHADHFREQFANILRHFDHLALSYEIGHTKPSREFYLACVRVAQASPSDCVFIDDLADNVAGAEAVGLTGIRYHSTPDLIVRLKKLGIDVEHEQQSG